MTRNKSLAGYICDIHETLDKIKKYHNIDIEGLRYEVSIFWNEEKKKQERRSRT